MTEKKEILEFADKTVDRAIEAACRHFNVDKEQLEITLITRGSTGLFGLGGRRAKITACLKNDVKPGSSAGPDAGLDSDGQERQPETDISAASDYSAFGEDDSTDADFGTANSSFDASAYAPGDDDESEPDAQQHASEGDYSPGSSSEDASDNLTADSPEEQSEEGADAPQDQGQEEEKEEPSEELLERLEKARVLTTQILDKAGLEAIVEIKADAKEPQLNISGEDISLIIGKDGHTLDSLEYIVNLNLKRTDERGGKRIHLDAQGYRAKREEGLRRTAEKLAYKAKKTRRSVAMAPMNSKERRVVHMAVKAISGVKTHSTGDGRLRKVIITPIKKGDGGKRHHSRRYNRKG